MPRTTTVSVTDELIDGYVTRPLAARLIAVVARTSMTPNQITALSAASGTAAAVGFWRGTPGAAAAGAVLLFAAMVLDCGDGQLARIRGGGSIAGRIFDGFADYWVSVAVHYGVLIHLGRTGLVLFDHAFDARDRFFLVLAAGLSMGVNAAHFDKHKQRYLAETKGVPVETADDYLAEARRTSSVIERAALYAFSLYVRVLQGRRAQAALREATVEEMRMLRLWSVAGPTMHFSGLCVAGLLVPFFPRAFGFYCVFAVILVNAYVALVWLLQGRASRLVQRRIA